MKPIDIRESRDIAKLKAMGICSASIMYNFIMVMYEPDEQFPGDACVIITQGEKEIKISTTQMRSIVKWLTTDHDGTDD